MFVISLYDTFPELNLNCHCPLLRQSVQLFICENESNSLNCNSMTVSVEQWLVIYLEYLQIQSVSYCLSGFFFQFNYIRLISLLTHMFHLLISLLEAVAHLVRSVQLTFFSMSASVNL